MISPQWVYNDRSENSCSTGPDYGYFPQPTKTWLIAKQEFYVQAQEVFKDTKVKITMDGLGAASALKPSERVCI